MTGRAILLLSLANVAEWGAVKRSLMLGAYNKFVFRIQT
jgi:hypothetical protein